MLLTSWKLFLDLYFVFLVSYLLKLRCYKIIQRFSVEYKWVKIHCYFYVEILLIWLALDL
jgi:hypothetical protein